ncbi:cobyrinate a,c-diamide synthase [Desulfovibrio sp. OttesenSCG-928-O18]|nr:cobyrinate a,c-diamide synthase [Desulfovibrio sp. OttesenSCG-928-O18]
MRRILRFVPPGTTLARMLDTSKQDRPRLVIAGTHSGSGKTSVVTALLSALTCRGISVQPFKVGPDYIDPAFHTFVTGVPSRNLDSWLLEAAVLRGLFQKHAPAKGHGVSIIEGVMGLFDGKGATHEGSTAHVAELLTCPVVLVISASGLSRSAAAMVMGYASFHPGARVAGVICNRIKTEHQYALIKESVERECGIPCLGYLPENPDFSLGSRHLGLVPAGEVANLAAKAAALGKAAAATIDLEALLALAENAPLVESAPLPPVPGPFRVRLGVARDEAFSFYYQDNLDLLQAMGAECVPFSPMRDAALPQNIHGLYFGGGFPEVFGAALADNGAMRMAVRNAVRGGLPVYAECGGMAYLCASLTDADGREHQMTGVFPESVAMTGKLQRFGYATAEFLEDTVLAPAGARVRVHEFHYSRLVPASDTGCLQLRKDEGTAWRDGLRLSNVLACYPHIHFYANTALAADFLACCAKAAP